MQACAFKSLPATPMLCPHSQRGPADIFHTQDGCASIAKKGCGSQINACGLLPPCPCHDQSSGHLVICTLHGKR